MKKIFFVLMLFFVSTLFAQEWKTSYSEALDESQQQNKFMLLVFAGSDWCGPCIKLDRTIWQSDLFQEYAASNLVLYKADFPRKKANQLAPTLAEKNALLAEKYNPNGYFPLVLLLDSNENVLDKTGYSSSGPQAYIEHLKSFVK